VGQSRTAPRRGWKMGCLVRHTLKLEGAGDTSPAAMAVSCWAGYHGPEMNSDNFDLFKQFQIDFN
jgi:hypothetical protein